MRFFTPPPALCRRRHNAWWRQRAIRSPAGRPVPPQGTPDHAIRDHRIAIGPAEAVIRLEGMEAVGQHRVVCVQRPQRRASLQHNSPQRHAKRTPVARQAEFLRHAGTRHDANAMRPRRQVERICCAVPRRWVQPLAINQQMQIRLVGQRQARPRPGAIQQPAPGGIDDGPLVRTGAQGGFAGWSQPLLALPNSRRLPSSR